MLIRTVPCLPFGERYQRRVPQSFEAGAGRACREAMDEGSEWARVSELALAYDRSRSDSTSFLANGDEAVTLSGSRAAKIAKLCLPLL